MGLVLGNLPHQGCRQCPASPLITYILTRNLYIRISFLRTVFTHCLYIYIINICLLFPIFSSLYYYYYIIIPRQQEIQLSIPCILVPFNNTDVSLLRPKFVNLPLDVSAPIPCILVPFNNTDVSLLRPKFVNLPLYVSAHPLVTSVVLTAYPPLYPFPSKLYITPLSVSLNSLIFV